MTTAEAHGPGASDQPRYCCAILTDSLGRLVLERRAPDDPVAGGLLACFGGGRERHEHAIGALRREVQEELGFTLRERDEEIRRVFTLQTPVGEAWFFAAAGPDEGDAVRLEPGVRLERISESVLLVSHADELARWHRAVFEARARGRDQATTI